VIQGVIFDGAQRSICSSSLKTNKKQILRSARDDMLGGFYRGDLPRGLFLRILKDGGFSERDFIES